MSECYGCNFKCEHVLIKGGPKMFKLNNYAKVILLAAAIFGTKMSAEGFCNEGNLGEPCGYNKSGRCAKIKGLYDGIGCVAPHEIGKI